MQSNIVVNTQKWNVSLLTFCEHDNLQVPVLAPSALLEPFPIFLV